MAPKRTRNTNMNIHFMPRSTAGGTFLRPTEIGPVGLVTDWVLSPVTGNAYTRFTFAVLNFDLYNAAVRELEGFRNEHIKIVTLYVIGPARRAQQTTAGGAEDDSEMRGTGGSNLAKLLKGMRDDTKRTTAERR
ncbi:hypothetical protein RSAG8_10965, partial [Rhizoctonia solani AG-8 WAC10335]